MNFSGNSCGNCVYCFELAPSIECVSWIRGRECLWLIIFWKLKHPLPISGTTELQNGLKMSRPKCYQGLPKSCLQWVLFSENKKGIISLEKKLEFLEKAFDIRIKLLVWPKQLNTGGMFITSKSGKLLSCCFLKMVIGVRERNFRFCEKNLIVSFWKKKNIFFNNMKTCPYILQKPLFPSVFSHSFNNTTVPFKNSPRLLQTAVNIYQKYLSSSFFIFILKLSQYFWKK